MATAMDVANFFLAEAPEEDQMTNLKLQKLCAYAQAISLAYAGCPLFEEELEAWTHGPVVPSVYNAFKDYAKSHIPPPVSKEVARSKFGETEVFILQMVWAAYGRFTAWALRDQSHWDFPGKFGTKEVISKPSIKEAFINNPLVKRMRRSELLDEAAYALDV